VRKTNFSAVDHMAWQYVFPSGKALETTTNTTFDVKFSRNIQSEDDFEIVPAVGSRAKFTSEDLRRLKAEFWAAHVQGRIRGAMRTIVENDFGGDRHWVAYTLSDITKKSVSNRTVQAWLMETGKPSSRTCPEWALQALKTFVSSPDNNEYLAQGRERRASDSSSSRAWSKEVDSKHSVKFATDEILGEERRLNEWRHANFDTLPPMIHLFEDQTQKYLNHLNGQLIAIEFALKKATTFEEFKSEALEAIRDKETAKWLVKDARRAIETKTGEFASDDGIVES
jgi:hypothetical protein